MTDHRDGEIIALRAELIRLRSRVEVLEKLAGNQTTPSSEMYADPYEKMVGCKGHAGEVADSKAFVAPPRTVAAASWVLEQFEGEASRAFLAKLLAEEVLKAYLCVETQNTCI